MGSRCLPGQILPLTFPTGNLFPSARSTDTGGRSTSARVLTETEGTGSSDP